MAQRMVQLTAGLMNMKRWKKESFRTVTVSLVVQML
jgi:hypothetical protein